MKGAIKLKPDHLCLIILEMLYIKVTGLMVPRGLLDLCYSLNIGVLCITKHTSSEIMSAFAWLGNKTPTNLKQLYSRS